jgi:hypothetical protein
MVAGLGHGPAVLQDRRAALHVADELGVIRAALGEHAQAFGWFRRAVEERSGRVACLRVDPRLDALHADPRFDRLVADATASAGS